MRFYNENISISMTTDDFFYLIETDATDDILDIIEQLNSLDEGEPLESLGELNGYKIIETDMLGESDEFMDKLAGRIEELFNEEPISAKEAKDEFSDFLDLFGMLDMDSYEDKATKKVVDIRTNEDVLLQEIVEMFEHVLL